MTDKKDEHIDVRVYVANVVSASRAAGFKRGKSLDDSGENIAEDEAVKELTDAIMMMGSSTADAECAARKMAHALRDIYNDVGYLDEIESAYGTVYEIVREHSG